MPPPPTKSYYYKISDKTSFLGNPGKFYVTTLYPLKGDELLSHSTGVACFRRNLLRIAMVDAVTDSDNKHPKMPGARLPYYYAWASQDVDT